MCQESKIIMYAQSVLKDNPKIYIAVLIAQAVHAGLQIHNPKISTLNKHCVSTIQKIAQPMKNSTSVLTVLTAFCISEVEGRDGGGRGDRGEG